MGTVVTVVVVAFIGYHVLKSLGKFFRGEDYRPRNKTCPFCHGTGKNPYGGTCGACVGTGKVCD